MINVYIEYGSATDHVATLQDEWVYMALLPAFEQLAKDHRGTLSESVFEDTRTDMAKKYILTGVRAIYECHTNNYEQVAMDIKNGNADIFEISSLDGIYELLEQLKGWDDFAVITSLERMKINKLL